MIVDRVVVFVDALPYEERQKLLLSKSVLRNMSAVQPGFGYSVNVKSELFAGKKPDEVGFFNEWTYKEGNGIKWPKLPLFLIRIINSNRIFKRLVIKILSKILSEDLRNIPLQFLDSMVRHGTAAYEFDFNHESIFSKYNVKRYLYSEYGDDTKAWEALCNELKQIENVGNYFLAMAGLDHIMHRDGKGSEAYYLEIEAVDNKLNTLWDILTQRDNSPELILVSDHGMAEVNQYVQFNLEENIPGVGKLYGYFVDATIARVWVKNEELLHSITKWFNSSELPGIILSEQDRVKWGLESEDFGNIIILLDEHVMFAPNFFGDKGCSAMHGYWPELVSQLGVLASSKPLSVKSKVIALEVHDLLSDFYGNNKK